MRNVRIARMKIKKPDGTYVPVGYMHNTGLGGVDLAALLPECRALKDQPNAEVAVWGWPFEEVTDPPLLQGDIHLSRAKGRRIKAGHFWTHDDASGRVWYGAKFYVREWLKEYDVIWWHLHDPLSDKEDEQ